MVWTCGIWGEGGCRETGASRLLQFAAAGRGQLPMRSRNGMGSNAGRRRGSGSVKEKWRGGATQMDSNMAEHRLGVGYRISTETLRAQFPPKNPRDPRAD